MDRMIMGEDATPRIDPHQGGPGNSRQNASVITANLTRRPKMPKSEKPAAFGAMPGLPKMPPLDMVPIIAANKRGLEAATQANTHALKRMALVNRELFGFVTRRLEHDRAAVKQLSTCKSPQDAMALFGTFFETAMRQYSEEISQMSAMYVELTTKTFADVEQEIEEIVETPTKG
ncbi:MAG: hypothetical protein ACJAW4_003362 [Paracoccaceae bacterium]|jgi:hypothetical protein